MSLPAWNEQPISKSHDRASFDCGQADLNAFLQRYARQSHQDNVSKTYCFVERANPKRVLGYYTVTPSAMKHEALPVHLTKGLARHEVSGFRLARLATDRSVAGRGLGGIMLGAATRRCAALAASGGGYLLIIDAKDDRVAGWYQRFGAIPVLDSKLTLVMHLGSFVKELEGRGLL